MTGENEARLAHALRIAAPKWSNLAVETIANIIGCLATCEFNLEHLISSLEIANDEAAERAGPKADDMHGTANAYAGEYEGEGLLRHNPPEMRTRGRRL